MKSAKVNHSLKLGKYKKDNVVIMSGWINNKKPPDNLSYEETNAWFDEHFFNEDLFINESFASSINKGDYIKFESETFEAAGVVDYKSYNVNSNVISVFLEDDTEIYLLEQDEKH